MMQQLGAARLDGKLEVPEGPWVKPVLCQTPDKPDLIPETLCIDIVCIRYAYVTLITT